MNACSNPVSVPFQSSSYHDVIVTYLSYNQARFDRDSVILLFISLTLSLLLVNSVVVLSI